MVSSLQYPCTTSASKLASRSHQQRTVNCDELIFGLNRLLNPECVLLKTLGKGMSFEIAVGMNGRIWIKARTTKQTMALARAIGLSEHMNNEEMSRMCRSFLDRQAGFWVLYDTISHNKKLQRFWQQFLKQSCKRHQKTWWLLESCRWAGNLYPSGLLSSILAWSSPGSTALKLVGMLSKSCMSWGLNWKSNTWKGERDLIERQQQQYSIGRSECWKSYW